MRAVPYTVNADTASLGIQIGDDAAVPFDEAELLKTLTGLPLVKTPAEPNGPMVIAVLFALVFLATMGRLEPSWPNCFVSETAASPLQLQLQRVDRWTRAVVATAVVIATASIFGGLWSTVAIAGLKTAVPTVAVDGERAKQRQSWAGRATDDKLSYSPKVTESFAEIIKWIVDLGGGGRQCPAKK